MKISELVEILQREQRTSGDLDVKLTVDGYNSFDPHVRYALRTVSTKRKHIVIEPSRI